MTKVAFIGLGNMGGPMAANLVKAGIEVVGFDLDSNLVDGLVELGGASAKTAIDAVENADYLITMLPAGKHVRQLYLGDETQPGLLDVLTRQCMVIDCSTIDAATAKLVAKHATEHDLEFMDAPVSGGTGGAQAGTLTFICGGTHSAFSRAESILKHMGANIFHAGDVGSGQIAKICNNMLLSVLMLGTSEALSLGIDNGLDPKVLSDIMKVSSGGNWTLDKYNPCPGVMETAPASNQYQGGFLVDLMVKDLGLAIDASLHSGSSTPLGALSHSLFVAHSRKGNGKLDFSSIFEQFSQSKNND